MAEYPYGEDYEFLVTDVRGQVACFSTGGRGPVPIDILNLRELNDAAVEALLNLPHTSEARMLVELPRPDDLMKIAELGCFGYDWHDVHRTGDSKINLYEPLSVPTRPCTVAALPDALWEALNVVSLNEVEFSSESKIDIRAFVQCVDAA